MMFYNLCEEATHHNWYSVSPLLLNPTPLLYLDLHVSVTASMIPSPVLCQKEVQ